MLFRGYTRLIWWWRSGYYCDIHPYGAQRTRTHRYQRQLLELLYWEDTKTAQGLKHHLLCNIKNVRYAIKVKYDSGIYTFYQIINCEISLPSPSVLQVVLCFSPVRFTLRTRARKFPALVNCTAIDWFHPWPQLALQSVSSSFIEKIPGLEVTTFI